MCSLLVWESLGHASYYDNFSDKLGVGHILRDATVQS
jgi:hypothetical protein